MIQSVSTAEDKTEFLRRIAHKPYFESTLGTHLHLFGNYPASGWAFYLLPGSAVLELRGGSAVLCGALPGGEAGEDAREELTGFLRFLHADSMQHAVELARGAAKPGDVVSLSPASASFDLYPNFEVRGRDYKNIVKNLK